MITRKFRYPNDPVLTVLEMNRAEFLEAYPRTPIRILGFSPDRKRVLGQVIPVPKDTICCDACNQDPLDDITVVPAGGHAYCRQCADRYVKPYYLPERNDQADG